MTVFGDISKDKLQKIVLVAIVATAVVAAVYIFYIGRAMGEKQKSRDNAVKLENDIQAAQSKAKTDRLLEEKRSEIMTFVEAQKGIMVTGDPYSWCVRQVSLFGEKHPVRILGIRPGVKSKHLRKEQYDVFEVQIEVEGTYDQLGRFVCGFENLFSTAEIRKLDVVGATDVERRVGLTIAFLMLPEAAAVKAPPQREKSEAP